MNAHILRRCYCADTSDSLRCDGPFDAARGRGASTTTEHTRRAHRMRSSDARRRRLVSRNGAGVGGVASSHSESSRPRLRPRIARGPSLPSSGFDVRRGAGLLQGRASNGPTKGAAIVLARRPSGGAPVAPWYLREASLWSPVVDERSNGRVPSAQKTRLEMRDAPAVRIAVGLHLRKATYRPCLMFTRPFDVPVWPQAKDESS